jgi:ribonuclease VapC
VLDSFALIAFLDDEPGAEKVSELIRQARDCGKPLLLCVVNWGEIYYVIRRASGKEAADKAMEMIETLPIDVVPADRDLTRVAAELKSEHRLSYADSFAAALAIIEKADLVTGDEEFRELQGQLRAIVWLQQ